MQEQNRLVETRIVPGFPGYMVGADGSVWSCWEKTRFPGMVGIRSRMSDSWHRVNPKGKSQKYLHVILAPGRKTRFIHRLVLEAFVGARPSKKHCCCHADGNSHNNYVANLRWDTYKQNEKDKDRHGTRLVGEKVNFAKMTSDSVRAIRSEYAEGNATQQQIADKYGISRSNVGYIVTKSIWKHLT